MNLFELFGIISIKTSDANKDIDETMEKAKELGGALGGVGESADGTSKRLKTGSKFDTGAVWLGNTLSKLSGQAAKLVYNLGKIGFGFNINMESYQYQFEALIGDAEKATQLVADLQELAKISPLGMEGLAKNAVTLLTTGTELTDILPTLEMLGNLSLGDTNRMQSVVKAYTQILGKGGLMAQEMYQLGDAMVPIVEIMTKYGGERYADGSWYQQKMADPTFKIPAEDMVKAFQAATAEGGKWHDYMLIIMDSFAGQADRLGEEGKETLGAFFEPFFEVAKSDVLPRLTESLGSFRTWVDENKEGISQIANALGTIATNSFDSLLSFFSWCVENKDAVGTALTVIGGAVGVIAASAHPILTVVSALSAIVLNWNSIVEWLQPAIDKWNALVSAIDNAVTAVERFLGVNKGTGVHISNSGRSHTGGGAKFTIPGFATGLDYVPHDNFLARLHEGEAVLTKQEAKLWRGDQNQNGQLASMVAAAVRDAVAGIQFNVSLDSGILVGQLAPGLDRQLGTLASRKGRG